VGVVSKKSLVLLGGLGILAYAFLSRPKVISTTFEAVPVPVPYAEPIPIIQEFAVETPLNLQNALDRIKEEYGDIFTKVTERVRKQRQIKLGAERYKMINYFENVTKEVKL
jgi:hypothetical protein|tara:strand:+ start:374 stop:706 length:333 start_codon:yes stop_codon:yes gene_type:complete